MGRNAFKIVKMLRKHYLKTAAKGSQEHQEEYWRVNEVLYAQAMP